ncbi:hypothetical protein HDU76_010098 [Blyttiomyces sp. JEL0837]|nr:hypothetical protein HDU76_010098 [Blyttiomyces sp. JEL0837]
MARILSKPATTGKETEKPILAQQRSLERAIDDHKLELKAKKALSSEKKQKFEIGRSKPESATNDSEKRLRKIATRGVVKLFNAIRAAQKTVEYTKSEGIQKNSKKAPTLSKGSFLQMIRESASTSTDKPSTASETTSQTKGSTSTGKKNTNTNTDGTEKSSVPWANDDFMMQPGGGAVDIGKAWDLDSD